MIINLISGPRNVSTALMYSFAQRDDMEVIDEPFYGYYLKETGIKHPGWKRIMKSMDTDIERLVNNILLRNNESKHIFLKNMAHHFIEIPPIFLSSVHSIFLIRHPSELLASFSKVISNPTLDDIGIKKSWEIYQEMIAQGANPIVVDSSELLLDPPMMLDHVCQNIGIPYLSSMESWPAGKRSEDGVWAEYWYSNVHRSTGFVASKPKKVTLDSKLESICQEALPYYNYLNERSLKI